MAGALASLLIVVHLWSVVYYRSYPSEILDYQGLAQKMAVKIKDEDLIFVHPRSWITTPIFYYLKPEKYQLVTGNFRKEVARHPQARVWAVEFDGQPLTKEMQAALAGFARQDEVASLRSTGKLYVR